MSFIRCMVSCGHRHVYWKISNILLGCSLGNRKSWKIRVKSIAGIETIIVAGVTSIASVASIASICPGLTVPPGLEGWVERSEGKLRWRNGLLVFSSLGGKPACCGEVGKVLLVVEVLEVLEVVGLGGSSGNLGLCLGIRPGRREADTEQHQKLHSDYLACLGGTVLCREILPLLYQYHVMRRRRWRESKVIKFIKVKILLSECQLISIIVTRCMLFR